MLYNLSDRFVVMVVGKSRVLLHIVDRLLPIVIKYVLTWSEEQRIDFNKQTAVTFDAEALFA